MASAISTPPRRERRRPTTVATPPRADNSDDDSDGASQTEQSPLKQARGSDQPSPSSGSPDAKSSPAAGTTRAQQRAAARRAAAAAKSDDDDAASGDGSGDDPAAPAPAERGGVAGIVRGIGKRIPKIGRRGAGVAEAAAATSSAEDEAEPDDEGDTAALVTPPADPDAEAENARLALGLTERVPPTLPKQNSAHEAELYRRPSTRGGGSLLHSSTLYAQPLAELADGLHVAPMPHLSARSQRLHSERLGSDFLPPSKARRMAPHVVLRQADPVRHVRVRPSHPGMQASVEMVRPVPSMHLVDAATRLSGTPNSLQVSIGLVQLHDHPLFREEHVLQRRLRAMAEQLGELHQRETLFIGRRRVIDLRRNIEPHLTGPAPTSAEEAERVRSLCVELLQARRERDEHECAERLLARRMLQLWQQLKNERRRQNFSCTRAKLQVQLINEDEENEAELEEEVEERRLLHSLSGAAEGPFEEEQVRSETAERQRALRRLPDEETLLPVYTEDTPPTEYNSVPAAERRRAVDAGRVALYAVLLVDGRVVGQTETTLLHPYDFCARFNTSMQLQMLQAPRALSLQLWQRKLGGFADVLISEVFLAVPDVASPAAPRWQHYSFASDRTFKSSQVPVRISGQDDVHEGDVAVHPVRCLCGQVNVSIAWASQPATRAGGAAGSVPSYTALNARGDTELSSGALDMARVRNHVRAEDLDPNAPRDVPLISLLSRSSRAGHGGGFRAFRFHRQLQLIKDWAFSDRQQLLQIRRERPHEWHLLPAESRAVPQRDTEINARMRELLQGGAANLAADDEVDDSKQQSKIRAWAKSVLAKQQRAKVGDQLILTTKDVVKEPLLEVEVEPFDLNAFLEKTFAPRRKLLPRASARKPEAASSDVARFVEVVIVEGVDLPLRSGLDASKMRLFVEISFQGQAERTEVKAGANPIWNQRLSFKLSPPNDDWSQQALMNMSADVSFNLFDQVDRSERDQRETNVRTVREEQRWLGSFTLPFSTLYRAGEVKGIFPISMPPILLGYSKDSRSTSKRLVPNSALQLFITINPLLPPLKSDARERFSAKDASMQEFALQWVKSVRGVLPPASKDRRKITIFAPTSSGEKALVCKFVRPQPPPPTSQMANDERTLLRFVSLIPFLDDAALGVSLDVWNTTKSFLDLCAGDAEEHALLLCNLFLAIGKKAYVVLGEQLPEGDTSYVLTRDGGDIRLWDACRGKVYSRESRTDPLSMCPLGSIGCVFDDHNIWANVQPTDRPLDMNWTLADPKCWRPFFGKGGFPQPKTLQSVQVAELEYRRTTDEYRTNVESEVEQQLQGYFEDLREHRPTDWNRSLANTLKKLLKRFELDASGGTELTQAEHDAQLERILATYSLQGFPIHISAAGSADSLAPPELTPLYQKLRNTNLWLADRPKIQFAITSYVQYAIGRLASRHACGEALTSHACGDDSRLLSAYPNNVVSIWVYVAALTDNRAA